MMRAMTAPLTRSQRPLWLQLRPWQEHSLVVTLAGSIYLAYGVFTFLHQTGERADQLRAVIDLTGGHFWPWAALWVTVGALAIVSSRWPVWSKLWGYAVMQCLATLWALAYFTGVLFLGVPSAGLGGGIVWGIVVVLWYAIARLANPSDLHTPPVPTASPDPGG
jgi:hypothetical protein